MTPRVFACALLCASAAAHTSASDEPTPKKKPVPVYTDDDLRRVSPLRDQTGGGMARPEPDASEKPAPAEKRGGQGEAYWRGQADRVRERLAPLRARADELRMQIEEHRRKPGVRPYSDPGVESLQRRLAGVEQRIRDAEDRLHERARRAGALPSWLR